MATNGFESVPPGAIGDIRICDADVVAIAQAADKALDDGLTYADCLTQNVRCGCMKERDGLYETRYGFREMRYCDIQGKLTDLKSKATISPCGTIRIPINKSSDDKSQIAGYPDLYQGEGIRHAAFETTDIYSALESSKSDRIASQDTTETCFDLVDRRLPGRRENIAKLRDLRILVGCTRKVTLRKLPLVFTKTVDGPVFFETIQRDGDPGSSQGNFHAPFEFLEPDQLRPAGLKNQSGTP